MEKLLAELARKNEDLHLAASYGKALLEEKDQLRNDLEAAQKEMKQLEECLSTDRHESQRALLEARRECDENVNELETKLNAALQDLHNERLKYQTARSNAEKTIELLKSEITALKTRINELTGEKEKGKEAVRKVSDALKLCEAEGQQVSLEQRELQKLVETLTSANKTYAQDVHTLTHTCDSLANELSEAKEQLEQWELKHNNLQLELDNRTKEFVDSQEVMCQLEIQVDRHRLSVATPTSSRSLHDELSESCASLDLLSESTSSPTQLPLDPEPEREPIFNRAIQGSDYTDGVYESFPYTDQSVTSTLRRSSHPLATWSSMEDVQLCPHCQRLEEAVGEARRELESVQTQLLIAVQQKISLQEQNEAWQIDMADMVQQSLHTKLEQEESTRSPERLKNTTKTNKKLIKFKKSQTVNKSEEYVKYSWML